MVRSAGLKSRLPRRRLRCSALRRCATLRPVGFLFLGLGLVLDGTDDDVRVAPFEPGLSLDSAVGSQVACEADEQLLTKVDVSDLAATELHHGFHTISFSEEANCMLHLEFVIVIIRVG